MPGGDQDHSRNAMGNAAQSLAHAQRFGKPRVGELERKAGDHQNNKAGQQNQVLPALVRASCAPSSDSASRAAPWPCSARLLRCAGTLRRSPRRSIPGKSISPSAPQSSRCPSDLLPSSRCTLVRVNFCVTPLWHWPQVASRLAFIDGGARIARRQNVMHAVATGAVGHHHRTALRGQSVITVQVTRHAVSRHAELLREPHALVAARAGVSGEFCSETDELGSMCALMEWIPWQSVQTGASPLPRHSLPVNALHELSAATARMALAAGRRNIELVNRRLVSLAGRISCAPWQSVQTAAFFDPFSMRRPCTLSW